MTMEIAWHSMHMYAHSIVSQQNLITFNSMKPKSILFAIIMASLMGCSGHENSVSYQDMFKSYADALNEYAKVIPIVGMDTESAWAANEVQAMRDSISTGSMSMRESLAIIYRMQTMASYGLNYALSVFAMPTAEGENAAYAFHSASVFNEHYSIERSNGFQRDSALCSLGDKSFFYTQIYAKLYNELHGVNAFSTIDFGCSLQFGALVSYLLDEGLESSDVMKVHTIIDGYSFFQSYVPLVRGFCMDEEVDSVQRPIIIKAANFFDGQMDKLFRKCAKSNDSIHAYLEKNFDSYVSKSLDYRLKILGFLTDNISYCAREWEKEQDS